MPRRLNGFSPLDFAIRGSGVRVPLPAYPSLREALQVRPDLHAYNSRNHTSLTDPAEIGAVLRAIDSYEGQPTTAAALKLAALVFVRPGELRKARWSEFDLECASFCECEVACGTVWRDKDST
jgi:integrase